jgi:hypothetical protein
MEVQQVTFHEEVETDETKVIRATDNAMLIEENKKLRDMLVEENKRLKEKLVNDERERVLNGVYGEIMSLIKNHQRSINIYLDFFHSNRFNNENYSNIMEFNHKFSARNNAIDAIDKLQPIANILAVLINGRKLDGQSYFALKDFINYLQNVLPYVSSGLTKIIAWQLEDTMVAKNIKVYQQQLIDEENRQRQLREQRARKQEEELMQRKKEEAERVKRIQEKEKAELEEKLRIKEEKRKKREEQWKKYGCAIL